MVSRLEERDVSMFSRYKTGIFLGLFVSLVQILCGASLTLPEKMRPGEMFVVSLQTETADEKIVLQFDAAHLQFLGAAQGTPDIQIRSDSEIEIKPASDKSGAVYDLRFLPLVVGATTLKMQHAAGNSEFIVAFSAEEVSRGYSWVILLVAVVLLVAGIKIWKYQKSAPEMMSTKSLFMNYEELEKARKLYGHDFTPATGSDAGQHAPADAGKKTLKHSAVKLPQSAERGASGAVDQSPVMMPDAPEERPIVEPDEKPVVEAVEESVAAESPSKAQKTLKKKAVQVQTVSDDRLAAVDNNADEPIKPAAEKPAPKKVSPAAQPAIVLPATDGDKKADSSDEKVAGSASEPVEPQRPASTERFVFAMEGNSRAYEAQGSVIRIGRRKENQICITASEISREHVELTASKGVISVRPLTETNTTRLNGRLVKDSQVIKPGDTLNLGGTDFIVVKARSV